MRMNERTRYKPSVGEGLVLKRDKRYSTGPNVVFTDTTVSKVGTKYFYIDTHPGMRISIEGWKSEREFSTGTVYKSREEYQEEQEWCKLESLLSRTVNDHCRKVTLEQLKAALVALDVGEEEQ